MDRILKVRILYIIVSLLLVSGFLFSSKTVFTSRVYDNDESYIPKNNQNRQVITPNLAGPLVQNISKSSTSYNADLSSAPTIHQIEDSHYSHLSYNFAPAQSSKNLSSSRTVMSIPTNTYNEKEVFGFLPYWQLANYRNLQFDKLSSIGYFSLTCYDNGDWVKDAGYTGFNSADFVAMRDLAHANNAKVILVVKNFDRRSIRDLVANLNGSGDKLIANIITVMKSKNLDGVNIDFEFVPSTDYPVTSSLRANFASWHNKLAIAVKQQIPGAQVSTDVFATSAVGYSAYDIAAIGKTGVDYIVFMTYDYIMESCWDGKKIAPMSPLYGNNLYGTPNWNVAYHLTQATKLAPSSKIIMGIPYYGIDFRVKDSDKDKYNALTYYPACDGSIETYGSIVDPKYDQYHNNNTLRWNDTEKARWYVYSISGTWRHGYYDDYSSLSAKYSFVRSTKLAGIGIWALGYDGTSKDLWNAIRDNFQRAPYIVGFRESVSAQAAASLLSSLNLDIIQNLEDNRYIVKPKGELSVYSIAKIRLYPEVLGAGFDGGAVERTPN